MRTVLVVALTLFASVALAGPLLPGTSQEDPALLTATPDFTAGLPANYANYVLLASFTSPYTGGGFTGDVTSYVWRDPIGSGGDDTLTFGYVFRNATPPPVLDIVRATIGDPFIQPWLGYTISDAGADASGASTLGGVAPQWTDGDPAFLLRDPTVSGEGLTIQWRDLSFHGTVLGNTNYPVPDVSALIWFDTSAMAYQFTNVGILDSGETSDAQAYAPLPVGSIPEPCGLALLGLGLAALARRRRKS